jgi:hypothetical protein
MDCFVASLLAMTAGYSFAFSRRDAPEVLKENLALETEGAGKTGRALHPRSRVRCASKNAAHEHTGSAENTRPSLRNGFTAYTSSPW